MTPVLWTCPLFTIYTYGLVAAVAFIVSSWLIGKEAGRRGLPAETISTWTLMLLVFGILGARILYVVLNWRDFSGDFLEIFRLQHGGLIWFGGFAGSLLGGIIFLRIHRLPVFKVLDIAAPYVALAQAIGRIGCFYNGCCYGKPSSWGIYFPVHQQVLFPSQILDSLTLLVLFVLLKGFKSSRPGRVFAAYLIGASVQRFLMEFIRGDIRPFYLSLSFYQWVCVGLFVFGVLVFALVPDRSDKTA